MFFSGTHLRLLQCFGARKFKIVNPRVVINYQTHLVKACYDYDIFTKMDSLHQRTVYPLPPHMEEKYEELDKEIEEFTKEVEENVGNYIQERCLGHLH